MTGTVSSHHVVSRGLTGSVRGSLYACAATALAGAITGHREIGFLESHVSRPSATTLTRLAQAGEASEQVLGVFGLCATVVAVLTIIWWYQAYRAVESTPVAGRSWSSGWAVGGWFIPLANLIIPKLVLNEVDRCSAALERDSLAWRGERLLPVANWWWALWVAGSAAFVLGGSLVQAQVEQGLSEPAVYRSGLQMLTVGLGVLTAAALCGASAIRVIGARVTR